MKESHCTSHTLVDYFTKFKRIFINNKMTFLKNIPIHSSKMFEKMSELKSSELLSPHEANTKVVPEVRVVKGHLSLESKRLPSSRSYFHLCLTLY